MIFLQSTILVMIITLFSKFLGFAREIFIAKEFGVSFETDAYFLAVTIPLILFSSLFFAISTTFIPVYTSIVNNKGEEEGLNFTNKILNLLICFLVISISVLIFFAPQIVGLIAIGFDGSTFELAVKYTIILLPIALFLGINQLFSGYLQAKKQFIASVAISIPSNLLIVLILIIAIDINMNYLIWATLAGSFLQLLFQIPFLRRANYKYTMSFSIKDRDVKQVIKLTIPVLLGTSIQQINLLIDRMLASGLHDGSISALNYATRLNGFVFGIVATSIATTIFPILSSLVSKNRFSEFSETTKNSLIQVTIITIPIVIGTMIFKKPIIKLLFEHGEFNSEATSMTADALFYYSFGMLFLGYREVLNRAFYSLKDTKTPMINGAYAILINIVLSFVLIRFMDFRGLALASSVAAAVTSSLLIYSLQKKMQLKLGVEFGKVLSKILVASLLFGICSYSGFYFLNNSLGYIFSIFISVMFGGAVYVTALYLLKVNEVQLIFNMFYRKFNKSKENLEV